MVDGFHGLLRETASEAGEGGMIRRRLIHGQPQELLEGDAIVDLGFQFGIGIDAKPLLQKQAFEKQEGMIGFASFSAFANGIASDYQLFDPRPVDDIADLIHSFDGAIAIQGAEKGDVRKGEGGFCFLERHSSSNCVNLEKL